MRTDNEGGSDDGKDGELVMRVTVLTVAVQRDGKEERAEERAEERERERELKGKERREK